MFFLLKLSVLTCVFYLGFTLLLEAGILAAVHISGIIGINFSRSAPFWIFFGLVWVGSFSLAWHITYSQHLAKSQELKNASSVFLNH
jgi:hypothetical protein